MKKFNLLVCALAAVTCFRAQSGAVGINTTNPHASAVLDLTSDTKGFLLPRLTTSAISTLSATASEGLVVYDKEQKKFLGWDGTKWQNLGFETTTSSGSTGLIATENFDSGNYTSIVNGGFGFSASGAPTFVSGIGVAPASPKYVTGNGLQSVNTTAVLTSGIIDATGYTNNITFSMRIASFSNTGTTNGADTNDLVTIAFDTGSGFVDELTFNSGGSNQRWDFTNNTVITSVFDGVAPSTSLAANASTLTVTNIPNSIKRVRISLLNNAAAEEWVIDDIKLTAQ